MNGSHDASNAGNDGPGGNQVEERQRRPSRPYDQNHGAEEHADHTFGDGPSLPDAHAGDYVDNPFDQGKGGDQEDDDADRQSGPDESDDTEKNGDQATKSEGAPITSHGF